MLMRRMVDISVHALDAGHITLPERLFVTPSDPEARRTVPSLSFLVQCQDLTDNTVTRIVFDLGIRRDVNLYPEPLQKHCANRQPFDTRPDVIESLARGNLTAKDIDYVILSHVHYDHIGYPKDFSSPKTRFIVGFGSLDLLSGKTQHNVGSHAIFEPDLLPQDYTTELPPTDAASNKSSGQAQAINLNIEAYTSLSPFPHALPLFPSDPGALYIVPAPGHLPGHINLLARISTSPLKYVLLAGDACHDMRLFDGTHEIATWTDEAGKACCIHTDIPKAKETIKRLAQVQKHGLEVHEPSSADKAGSGDGDTTENERARVHAEVEVIFAHNWAWEQDAKEHDRFWPGKL